MWILRFLPKKAMSRLVGWIVHLRLPLGVGSLLALGFARIYKIDLTEAEKAWHEYPSIGDLFIRKLKIGARPIAGAALVHPADSRITANGVISNGTLIQAKGHTYTLKDFTLDQRCLEKWEGGYFITYYLCPTDYHRVHSPVEGRVVSTKHLVGELWPVNDWSVQNVDSLFAVNERLNFEIETEFGSVLLVMVGATNVGMMTSSLDASIRSQVSSSQRSSFKEYAPALNIQKGQELGIFHMGSTVIMLYPPSAKNLIEARLGKGPIEGPVRMGEGLV